VDLAGHLDQRSFPWRTAALVAGIVAVAELAGLLALAGVKLAPSFHHGPSAPAASSPPAAPAATHAAATTRAAASAALKWTAQPLRARSHVSVLVLNGNGITGAAGNEAARLLTLGYRSATSRDAPNHSYAHSLVLFSPGYEREGKRLGRDTGISIVGPLDGLTPAQIKGSQLVVILGDS
jgi:LytR cell envelope-related transcriptional attenuator